MYNHEPTNYICPLCQISKGQPTEKGNKEESVIFRDKFLTAFVSGKWWRSNKGHVIIVPNQHIENIFDISEDLGNKIFALSKKVAIALKEAYRCDGISTRQHNEPAGNQDVWHYHLHVFPRYEGDNLYINHTDTYWPSQEEVNLYADKLKQHL